MASTCGYICPQCNGSGIKADSLENCDWCQKEEISDKKWIETVHESACCSDIGNNIELINSQNDT